MKAIAVEDVYDSVFDDDLFRDLPARLNAAYGARSCTMQWWHSAGDAEVMAHSGYFTDEQMLDYATNFTQTDLWSLEGLHPGRANQVWNCDDLVPASHYEASPFYNDWIRAIGDDTFHCIGIAMRTRWGFGLIGLHRGRSQGGFSKQNVRALETDVVHLRRMLTMRGRLANVRREAISIAAAFDVLGQAVFLVDAECRVRHGNSAAEALLNYWVDSSGDMVVEAAGQGLDRVNASVSYMLGADVEQLVMTGTPRFRGPATPLAT